jgi:hypothetical protein
MHSGMLEEVISPGNSLARMKVASVLREVGRFTNGAG